MRWLLALCLLLATRVSLAGEPPAEPFLRVETGMHTSVIKRIGVDVNGQWMMTAADDKTARLWDLRTGQQLRVFRPPIGAGNEGKLYCGTMSPDGHYVAVGGWTGYEWDSSNSVYIFDRATGVLVRRLDKIPSVVLQVAFSLDGQRFVVGMGSSAGTGIRVFRVNDWAEIAKDDTYSGDTYTAHFDKSGRLVTASYDGQIRLYDANVKLIAQVKAPGGTRPYGIRFSPDGSLVAVGYDDARRVDVLSGKDLTYLYSPDTKDVNNGNLIAVSWSLDGNELFAGGMFWRADNYRIKHWSDRGRTPATSLLGSNGTVLDFAHTRQGLLFGSGDPAFGRNDWNSGTRSLFVGPAIADLRENFKGLRVSADGRRVRFAFEVYGKGPAEFSVADRHLTLNPADDPSLSAAILDDDQIHLTDWNSNVAPKVNNNPITLDRYEMARAVAIAADRQSFMLAADWSLRKFSPEGAELWRKPVLGIPWNINQTEDGRIVITAQSDGTIRWWRASDGEELLAFFPHADRKRWVLWTPSGYYDASPGGEDLIGWHVNRGKAQSADFFPASHFRSKFYRPDVVSLVLSTLDESAAIEQANASSSRKTNQLSLNKLLPPVVTVLSPSDGASVGETSVRVRVSVRSPSGEPVSRIWALVDGRPVGETRGLVEEEEAPNKDERVLTVPIASKDCAIAILAETKYAVSEPSVVRVRWSGAAPKSGKENEVAPTTLPKLYVLAIGVSGYKNKELALAFPAKDAKDFVDSLKKQKGKLYREVEAKLLTDEEATKDNILDALEWLQRQTTQRDVAMLFMAGHGINDPSNSQFFYLPYEANLQSIKRTMLPDSEVRTTLNSIPGKVLAFLDTCHSGSVVGDRKLRDASDINQFINELSSAENGIIVFSSSTGRQLSQESPEWKNGAFTKALVEGLSGKADMNNSGRVTVEMLSLYVSERVKTLTKGFQTPAMARPATIADFPIAVSK
jgi:WD40 repeat protein